MAKAQSIGYRLGWAGQQRVQPITTNTERMRGRHRQRRNQLLLSAEPLCRECAKHGRTTAAQEIDHIIPLHMGGTEHEANLQPLCIDCHKAKTAAEASNR